MQTLTKPLRYHLRFQILPGENVARDARDLAAFCLRHGVEEVVLFFAAEEWNNGLLSRQEEDAWFGAVAMAAGILKNAGVGVSLNPWMTVLHCDRGRKFPADRRFKPMVSPDGQKSRACASFADPAWQRYFTRLMARFATIGVRVIWVEDDFRYHNHAPLAWGGGFEPEVLARFARKLGKAVPRAAVVESILKPGQPHPWRGLWLQTWREIQLEVARKTAAAVARAGGGRTRLGLMSSLPAVHSVEGRDWRALFKAMSIGGQVAHRPHFAGYADSLGATKTYSIMMLDLQKTFRPPGCEVAPEIENFSFTRWTKSDVTTWSDMALALLFGSDALLLDIFPFSGNRASAEPQIGEMLDRCRPGLEWLAARFTPGQQTCGVGLPWREDAQTHVQTAAGRSLHELDASSFGPGFFLLPYGVPVQAAEGQVNAVFGSMAWAFSDADVERLLRGGLLLDSRSAGILAQRGFGDLLGMRLGRACGREDDTWSVEQVVSPHAGAPLGHFFNANLLDSMPRLEPRDGAEEWTAILRPDRTRFGAGIVAHRNRLGGRVVTYAAADPARLPRCYHRQALVQRVVRFLASDRFDAVLAVGAPHCLPVHLRRDGTDTVVVINAGLDPARPTLSVPGRQAAPRTSALLLPAAKPARATVRVTRTGAGLTIEPGQNLPYLSFLVLQWT